MTGTLFLLIMHAAVTWFMAGLIWFVQWVHYPLMAMVAQEEYASYHRSHMQRITWLVVPAMLLELLSALLLLTIRPPDLPMAWAILGLALLVLIWACTFFLIVPQHNRLEEGFDERVHHLLLSYNWTRTLLWSARAVLVAYMLYHILLSDKMFSVPAS